MEEILEKLISKLKSNVGHNDWSTIILSLMRLRGTVNFSTVYTNENNEIQDVEVNFGFWDAKLVHKLHELTSTINNWNRAKIKLFSDGRYTYEFTYDKDLQEEVDRLNNE